VVFGGGWGGEGGRWLSVPALSMLPIMMFLLSTNHEVFVYIQDISSLSLRAIFCLFGVQSVPPNYIRLQYEVRE